jgi:hypothetical protein
MRYSAYSLNGMRDGNDKSIQKAASCTTQCAASSKVCTGMARKSQPPKLADNEAQQRQYRVTTGWVA